MEAQNLAGKKFGKLTVISKSHSDNGVYWNCKCECGKYACCKTGHLNSGQTISCGCQQAESRNRFFKEKYKHGMVLHPLFTVWQDMNRRCTSKDRSDYRNYGGRGITVCERWKNNFAHFYEDMGECPKGMTLERIDTNKGYFKENCKWATRAEQNRNSRFSKWWHIKGKVFESAKLAGDYYGVSHSTIINWCRLQKGDCWSELKYFGV